MVTLFQQRCARSTCNIRVLSPRLLIAIRIGGTGREPPPRAHLSKSDGHDHLNFGRELRQIVNAKAFLDSRHFVHDLLKPVLAK